MSQGVKASGVSQIPDKQTSGVFSVLNKQSYPTTRMWAMLEICDPGAM
jgi:hypothetical protein